MKQWTAYNILSNHFIPRSDQSLILPKQAMRDKRFADRIAAICTGFYRKPVLNSN